MSDGWERIEMGNAHKIYHMLPNRGVTPELLEKAVAHGMFARNELEDGVTYTGHCRNASQAVWHADKGKFIYQRQKFGQTFSEDIVHPQDDEGYDVFVPVGKVEIKEPHDRTSITNNQT